MKQILCGLVAMLAAGVASAYEEPAYVVIEERQGYELRRYAPYLVAETTVEADFDSAGGAAFRRLFGYISGDNRGARSIATTVPVGSAPRSEKIAMTIPVVATTPAVAADQPALYTYAFVMPSSYTLETLPEPTDARITLREIPARAVAALRYSGRSNRDTYLESRARLLEALQRDGVTLAGEPLLAVYNGPFTPGFMRRNEVLVDVR
jgi:hypothetical protein